MHVYLGGDLGVRFECTLYGQGTKSSRMEVKQKGSSKLVQSSSGVPQALDTGLAARTSSRVQTGASCPCGHTAEVSPFLAQLGAITMRSDDV